MTHPEFDIHSRNLYEELLHLGSTKGKEYAGDVDRFDNFKSLGTRLGMSPQAILWVYVVKHLNAIEAWIKTGHTFSEPIEGRIKDAIVYLMLLHGIQAEQSLKAQTETLREVMKAAAVKVADKTEAQLKSLNQSALPSFSSVSMAASGNRKYKHIYCASYATFDRSAKGWVCERCGNVPQHEVSVTITKFVDDLSENDAKSFFV